MNTKTIDGHWLVRVAKVDCPNGNKRIYPKKVFEKVIEDFNRIPNASMLGQMGMPNSNTVHLAEVSHVIHNIYFDGDYVKANIEVLNTPSGKVLGQLLNAVPNLVCFRTQGLGNGKVNSDGNLVIDKYKMTTINVLESNEGARFGSDKITVEIFDDES